MKKKKSTLESILLFMNVWSTTRYAAFLEIILTYIIAKKKK